VSFFPAAAERLQSLQRPSLGFSDFLQILGVPFPVFPYVGFTEILEIPYGNMDLR
jgi:hypothetical protein